jgi:hypothetical protein
MTEKNLPASFTGYETFFQELTESIRLARLRAGLAVNHELTMLYWSIGHRIREQEEKLGWGAKVVDQLAADLRRAFPDMIRIVRSKFKIHALFC